VQRRIERALLHSDDVARELLQPLRDAVAMQRPQRNDFQDEHVERALRQVGLRQGHQYLALLHVYASDV
jgi:hypothetical protein